MEATFSGTSARSEVTCTQSWLQCESRENTCELCVVGLLAIVQYLAASTIPQAVSLPTAGLPFDLEC